jgi:hypothetical protein
VGVVELPALRNRARKNSGNRIVLDSVKAGKRVASLPGLKSETRGTRRSNLCTSDVHSDSRLQPYNKIHFAVRYHQPVAKLSATNVCPAMKSGNATRYTRCTLRVTIRSLATPSRISKSTPP